MSAAVSPLVKNYNPSSFQKNMQSHPINVPTILTSQQSSPFASVQNFKMPSTKNLYKSKQSKASDSKLPPLHPTTKVQTTKNTPTSNSIFDLSKKFANLKSASNLFNHINQSDELVVQVQNSNRNLYKYMASNQQITNDLNPDLEVVQDQST